MRVEGEVIGFELFGGLGVGGIVQQDGAENGLFGVNVRGQSGFEASGRGWWPYQLEFRLKSGGPVL